jgi:hypothetical protein
MADIVKLPVTEDETQRRIEQEARRLCDLAEVDRVYQLATPDRYRPMSEAIGMEVTDIIKALRAIIVAILKERTEAEKAETRKGRQQEKAQKAQTSADEKAMRQRRTADERAAREAEKARAKAEREAEKEAERKAKEKAKALATIARLPVARHANELARLAERIGDDVDALREEFEDFLGVESDAGAPAATEPWPEPVDLAELLMELSIKTARYVAMPRHFQMTAAVLWAAHAWTYDHDIPVHSPMLAATSPDPTSGKSTLISVLGYATPRFRLNIETTGPTLYRFVDQYKPTLGLDEADDIFHRRSDLKHIINAGWTRGSRIPRQEKINGVWTTLFFDPFCPKMIGLLGKNLPHATRTRCIELRMEPKRDDERAEDFDQRDDAEFAVLRRKFARWAADNAAALKDAKPIMPGSITNRAAANWKLLLAIADLAGSQWPVRAREAAERLTRTRHRPSLGVQMLAEFKEYAISTGKKLVTSEAMEAYLRSDPTSVWADYNRGGPITQRQIAILLEQYEIYPRPLHPTGRKDFARRGYKISQFTDAFARYLPGDPIIRSSDEKPPEQAKRRAKRAVIG